MGRGKVSAMKIKVVFLLAVIGQRLAGNLSSGNATAIGEYREEQSIHASALLQDVKNFFSAFVDK